MHEKRKRLVTVLASSTVEPHFKGEADVMFQYWGNTPTRETKRWMRSLIRKGFKLAFYSCDIEKIPTTF